MGVVVATFVLLHGAWHGAWCWEAVAGILRGRGHAVGLPVQRGLGERASALSNGITLESFADDLVGFLETEDLTDVVLVGHSFGGTSVTAAAARVPGRIARLVYLDAMLPQSGEPPCDLLPPEVWAARRAAADRSGATAVLPCPPASAFGIMDPAQQAWVEARLTPHPLRTYETVVEFDGSPGNGLPATYVMVTAPVYGPLAECRSRARALGWAMTEIATGHDAMVSAPQAVSELLVGLA